MGQLYVSHILIDDGSSCGILYSSLFKKICLGRGSLIPYTDSDLQAFNGTTTHPWGYIELMVYVVEGIDIQSTSTQFLVILCMSLYNFILGIPFTATLDNVASPVYLKLKYHNLHGELTILLTDLEVVKMIHNTLQQD